MGGARTACADHRFAFNIYRFAAGLFAVIIFTMVPTWASENLTFQDCAPERQQHIAYGVRNAQVIVDQMQNALSQRLQSKTYDRRTTRKLKKASQVLECIQEQLPSLDFLCLNSESKSMRDVAEIRRGNTIRLYNLAFTWQGYFAPVLVHEVSHICGTNDRYYFHFEGQHPNMAAHKRWDKIASLYDWWVVKGLCVPGDDC